MSLERQENRPTSRRLQFSLKRLMTLMLGAGLLFGVARVFRDDLSRITGEGVAIVVMGLSTLLFISFLGAFVLVSFQVVVRKSLCRYWDRVGSTPSRPDADGIVGEVPGFLHAKDRKRE